MHVVCDHVCLWSSTVRIVFAPKAHASHTLPLAPPSQALSSSTGPLLNLQAPLLPISSAAWPRRTFTTLSASELSEFGQMATATQKYASNAPKAVGVFQGMPEALPEDDNPYRRKHRITVWAANQAIRIPPPVQTFQEADLPPPVLAVLQQLQFQAPTPIQVPCCIRYAGTPSPTDAYYCSTVLPPPPLLYKLQPCPSDSGRRDHINLGPNLIRYQI